MTAKESLAQGLIEIHPQIHPQAVDKLMDFCGKLLNKNKVMNLTGAADEDEVVSRHFLDCAAAYAGMEITNNSVVDVGTGAGFPGIPLAILYPRASFTLLDSLNKRILFLQESAAALGLHNAEAVHARAEEFAAEHRESYDLAVSRAVADLRVLAELSLPLVKIGGIFAPMKSTGSDAELKAAENAIQMLGGELEAVRDYIIPGTEVPQRVVLIRKIKETPGKYPRRFAKITAQPL